MIVLAAKLRVSEAEVHHECLPMTSPRVRGANRDECAACNKRPYALLRQCGKQGLTPKLSRDA